MMKSENAHSLRSTLIGTVILTLATSCMLYTVFKPHNIEIATRQLEIHNRVLDGKARAPVQYQLYLQDEIIERMFSFAPKRTPIWFSATYMVYYSAGLLLFFAFLYRLCLQSGSSSSALFAMLYLVAIMNIFWFDNDYHPNDPWGALLAVFIVGELLAGRTWRYFGLLFLSGFFWEKHLLIPFSVAAMELWSLQRRSALPRIGAELIFAILIAFAGQLLPRMIYGTERAWFGPPPGYNLSQLHLYIWGMAVVFGLPIAYLILRVRKVPLVLGMLAIQFPVWLAIYVLSPGVLREMRGILVMVPLTWPLMVRALDEWVFAANDSVRPCGITEGHANLAILKHPRMISNPDVK